MTRVEERPTQTDLRCRARASLLLAFPIGRAIRSRRRSVPRGTGSHLPRAPATAKVSPSPEESAEPTLSPIQSEGSNKSTCLSGMFYRPSHSLNSLLLAPVLIPVLRLTKTFVLRAAELARGAAGLVPNHQALVRAKVQQRLVIWRKHSSHTVFAGRVRRAGPDVVHDAFGSPGRAEPREAMNRVQIDAGLASFAGTSRSSDRAKRVSPAEQSGPTKRRASDAARGSRGEAPEKNWRRRESNPLEAVSVTF
jgi:hypothetical protein